MIVPSRPSTTPETVDLPECVKQMLRPNAFTDHLMFEKDTLIKIFNTAYKEIPFRHWLRHGDDLPTLRSSMPRRQMRRKNYSILNIKRKKNAGEIKGAI